MHPVSFAELIAPLSPPEFFRHHWQRQVLWSPTSVRVETLVSLADIDYLLSSLPTPDVNWMRLVKEGSTLPQQAFCTGESFVSLPKVYGAYQAGYTIQLAKMHKRWSPVGHLCRAVESAFLDAGVPLAQRIGSHLYLTPVGSVGLDPHYDNHDVIVVQIEGSKRWKVYGALQEFPVEMQKKRISRDQLPPLEHDIELAAGQLLYIPRGFYHEALTEDHHSVHVTLDVFPSTWADLVSRILLAEPRFRQALPAGSWSENGASAILEQGFRERVEGLLGVGDLHSVARRMQGELLDHIDPLPEDGFRQLHELGSLTLDTVLARRPGALPRLIGNGDDVQLRFAGSGFRGHIALVPVFRFLLESPRFAVRQLPDLLSADSKLEIARELIREGLLEVSAPS